MEGEKEALPAACWTIIELPLGDSHELVVIF
jgi:hypothetical protein